MAGKNKVDPPPDPPDWSLFEGVYTPTFTQVPDDFLDWIIPFLTSGEVRVALYMMRRTFGYKDRHDGDNISIDQLCNGIVKLDGERLDCGTQLKRTAVLAAVKGLIEKRIILAERQEDSRGTKPTFYRVNVRSPEKRTPAFGKTTRRDPQIRPTGVQETAPTIHSLPIHSASIEDAPSLQKTGQTAWAALLDANRLGVPEHLAARIRAAAVSVGAHAGYLKLVVRAGADTAWITRQVGKRLDEAAHEAGLIGAVIEEAP